MCTQHSCAVKMVRIISDRKVQKCLQSTMTEVEDLFGTFLKLWRAGKNAHLNIECHDGKALATLCVSVRQPPPPPPQQHHQPLWLVGPSRLRRRAVSRAQAGVEAAENIVVHATDKRK